MKEIQGGIHFFRKSGCFVFEFTILTIGLFLIVNPIDVSASLIPPPQQDQDNGVCNTDACKETATQFLKNMDDTVDPCDDFYQYACGNFIKNTKIPDDESMISNFNTLMVEKQKKLNESLSSSINEKDYKALKLLKLVYQSCMDTEKIKKLGLTEITDKIKSMGGWPVVDGSVWDESGFNWLEVVNKSQQFGFATKLFYTVNKVSKLSALQIGKPSLDTGVANLISDPKYPTTAIPYLKFITAIAETFGAKKDDPDTEKQMSEVFDFMKNLLSIPISSTNGVASISVWSTTHPNIPWRAYINATMPEKIEIPENTILYADAQFIMDLESLLARTPKRTIANYAMTQVVLSVLPYLNDAVEVHSNDFLSKMTGATKSNERWKTCIKQIERDLPIAVSSVYVREHLNGALPIKDVRDIFRHLKEALGEMIEQSYWMDYTSKVYALAKVQVMGNRVGYPKDLLEDKKVDEYYKELQLSKNLYFKDLISNAEKSPVDKVNDKPLQEIKVNDKTLQEIKVNDKTLQEIKVNDKTLQEIKVNDKTLQEVGPKIQNVGAKLDENNEGLKLPEVSYLDIGAGIRKFYLHKKMANFGKTSDDNDDWEDFARDAAVVNAYYAFQKNKINIPPAPMGGNFFNKDRPQSINYGALGMTLGHEMSHGFGPSYITYEKNGYFWNWMTPASTANYNLHLKCITDQYSGYLVKDAGMTIDGHSTLDESFADLVGITTAYTAYKKSVDEYRTEQKLPGINRSPEQLFWLSVANMWCTKKRPLNLKNELAFKKSHPPAEARIVLSLRNNPQFAKDFNCKSGSRMHPEPKCIVL